MIKQIRIIGFKSLADVTVDLAPITILVGKSGAGKTNFMDAIRFLRDLLLSRNIHAVLNPHGGWPADAVVSTTRKRSRSIGRSHTLGEALDQPRELSAEPI